MSSIELKRIGEEIKRKLSNGISVTPEELKAVTTEIDKMLKIQELIKQLKKTENEVSSKNDFLSTKGGDYYSKYLKYKQKYINLKKELS